MRTTWTKTTFSIATGATRTAAGVGAGCGIGCGIGCGTGIGIGTGTSTGSGKTANRSVAGIGVRRIRFGTRTAKTRGSAGIGADTGTGANTNAISYMHLC